MSGNRPVNSAKNVDFHVQLGIFYMPHMCDMEPTALLPFRRKVCLRIFPLLKIRRLWPGLNPRPWVPEAITLTPRPPKPLWLVFLRLCSLWVTNCGRWSWSIVNLGVRGVSARYMISLRSRDVDCGRYINVLLWYGGNLYCFMCGQWEVIWMMNTASVLLLGTVNRFKTDGQQQRQNRYVLRTFRDLFINP
jgi:hypothetical protein